MVLVLYFECNGGRCEFSISLAWWSGMWNVDRDLYVRLDIYPALEMNVYVHDHDIVDSEHLLY